jgi:hypothetical protein
MQSHAKKKTALGRAFDAAAKGLLIAGAIGGAIGLSALGLGVICHGSDFANIPFEVGIAGASAAISLLPTAGVAKILAHTFENSSKNTQAPKQPGSLLNRSFNKAAGVLFKAGAVMGIAGFPVTGIGMATFPFWMGGDGPARLSELAKGILLAGDASSALSVAMLAAGMLAKFAFSCTEAETSNALKTTPSEKPAGP